MTAPEIRWVTYYVLTRGFMLGSFIGLLPYLVFQRLDVDVLGLSLVLGSYTLAAFVTARYSQQILRRAGQRTVAVATGVVLLLSLVVFAVSTSLAAVVLAMILLGAASGGVRPATLGELSRAAAEHRGGAVPGWLLSRMEGAFGLCNAVVVLAGGVVIQFWSFPAAMLALAVLYVLVQAVTTVVANRASVDTAITYS
jgi:predicted MFS family arabinose efflux permease